MNKLLQTQLMKFPTAQEVSILKLEIMTLMAIFMMLRQQQKKYTNIV